MSRPDRESRSLTTPALTGRRVTRTGLITIFLVVAAIALTGALIARSVPKRR